MKYTIPLLPVPSQVVSTTIRQQNIILSVYLRNGWLFSNVNINGSDVALGTLVHDRVPIIKKTYLPILGNVSIVDQNGTDDPVYTGLGSRFVATFDDGLV